MIAVSVLFEEGVQGEVRDICRFFNSDLKCPGLGVYE